MGSNELRHILPNRGLLTSMLDQKYIRLQRHPTEPLVIFNYTEKATFDKVWNDATRLCRGLVLNEETNEVVARPFPKFFNHNESQAPKIDPDELVFVNDKVDGSLGIRYWQPKAKRWAIATRGSFTSDQALHATQKLDEYLDGDHANASNYILHDYTELYEIIYPSNRIVLDYGDLDTLVKLAYVENATGKVLCITDTLGQTKFDLSVDKSASFFGQMKLSEALALPDRANAEGIVLITASKPQRMVKVKQSDYVAMHRTITGLNAKVIWDRVSSGETLDQLKWGMPEELWGFIEKTHDDLVHTYGDISAGAKLRYAVLINDLDKEYGQHMWNRKQFADKAVKYASRDLLFLLLDERPIDQVVWKKIKPRGDDKPFAKGEDVA